MSCARKLPRPREAECRYGVTQGLEPEAWVAKNAERCRKSTKRYLKIELLKTMRGAITAACCEKLWTLTETSA